MRSNFSGGTPMTVARHQPRGVDYFLYSKRLKAEERRAALNVAGAIDHNTLGVWEGDLPYISKLVGRSERQRDEFTDMILDGKDLTSKDVGHVGRMFRESKVVNKAIQETKLNAQKIAQVRDFTRKAGLQSNNSNYYNAIYNKSIKDWGGTFGPDGEIREFSMSQAPDWVDMQGNLESDLRAAAPHMTRAEIGHIASNIRPFAKRDPESGLMYHGFDLGVNKEKYENFEAINNVLKDHSKRINTEGTDEYNLMQFEHQYGRDTGLTFEGQQADMITRFGTTAVAYMNEEMRNMPSRYAGLGWDSPTQSSGTKHAFSGYDPSNPYTPDIDVRQKKVRKISTYNNPENSKVTKDGVPINTFDFILEGGSYKRRGPGSGSIEIDKYLKDAIPDMGIYNSNTNDFNYEVFSKPNATTHDAISLLGYDTESPIVLDENSQRTQKANNTYKKVEELKARQFNSKYGFDEHNRTNYDLRITQEDLNQALSDNEEAVEIIKLKTEIYNNLSDMNQDNYQREYVHPGYMPINLNQLIEAKPGSPTGNEVFFEAMANQAPGGRATIVTQDKDVYEFSQTTTGMASDWEEGILGVKNINEVLGRLYKTHSLTEGKALNIGNGYKVRISSPLSQVNDSFRLSDYHQGTDHISGKTNEELDQFDANYDGGLSFEIEVTNEGTGVTKVGRVFTNNPFKELERPIDKEYVVIKNKYGEYTQGTIRQAINSLTTNGSVAEVRLGFNDSANSMAEGFPDIPITIERKNRKNYVIRGLNKIIPNRDAVELYTSREDLYDTMGDIALYNQQAYLPIKLSQLEKNKNKE